MKAYRKSLLLENREFHATGPEMLTLTEGNVFKINISNNTKNPTLQTQQRMIENCYKE